MTPEDVRIAAIETLRKIADELEAGRAEVHSGQLNREWVFPDGNTEKLPLHERMEVSVTVIRRDPS